MTNPIIITGGSQRLGLAISQSLLSQGRPVVVTYRTEKLACQQLREAGAELLQVNFQDVAQINQFIEHITKHYSSIRGIIHNASDWLPESADTQNQDVIQQMMQVHVHAPYLINLGLAEALRTSPQQSDIIHMTDYVQDKGSKKHIAYAASKAALHNLTLSFSALLAPKVKVNSIAPSLLMFNQHDSEQYKQKALRKSLLQTCPGPQEAVDAVNYVLKSQFMTGRTLYLDGGRHLV